MEASKNVDNGLNGESVDESEGNTIQGEETESSNLLSATSASGEGILVQGSGGSKFQVTPAIVVHEVEPNQNGKSTKVDIEDEPGKYYPGVLIMIGRGVKVLVLF